jgi:hypothetical protein
MKKTILALALLVLTACSQTAQEVDEFGIPAGQEAEVKAAQALKMKEVACEDSGGNFENGECKCPTDTYGENIPLYTYEEETGYCIDAFGLPGGVLGEEAKEKNPINN